MSVAVLTNITKKTAKQMAVILPVFFLAVLFSVVIDKYLPQSFIDSFLSEKSFWAIPLAAIVGIIFPIPRYATYPIAFVLFSSGAGVGVAFALISGEVISESIIRDVVEIKYFGFKFFSARLIFSTIGVIVGGYIIEIIL